MEIPNLLPSPIFILGFLAKVNMWTKEFTEAVDKGRLQELRWRRMEVNLEMLI